MTKLFVTYEIRKADECMLPDIERLVCEFNPNDLLTEGNMTEVIETTDRIEYLIKDHNHNVVGGFILTLVVDMHFGRVGAVVAHWVKEPSREANELFMWYLKSFCKTHGVKQYQRSRHVSPSRQLLITKEV